MPRLVLIPLDERSYKLSKPNEFMVDYNDRQHLSTRIGDKTYSKTRDLEYMITDKIESDRILNNSMSDSGILYSDVVTATFDKLKFKLPFSIVNINGYILQIPETDITIQIGTSTQDYNNDNTYADLVYLECYKTDDTIEEILPNGLTKVTRISKFKTFIRVVNHIDFSSYHEGITSPLVRPLNLDGNIIPSVPTFANLSNQDDLGCYIVEDEDIQTIDHKIYAMPLFKIKRRNVGVFSKINLNHGIDSSFIVKGGSDVAFSYVNQILTTTKLANVTYVVGKTYTHYKDITKRFKVTEVTNSTSIKIENTGETAVWSISATDKFILDSGRPDNKSSTIIYDEDIIDMRHFVSFAGYNYNQLLKDNFNKLIQGSLNQYNFKTIAFDTNTQTNSSVLYRSLGSSGIQYTNYFKKNINSNLYIAKDTFKGKTKGTEGSLITYLDTFVTLNENIKNLSEKECNQTIYDNLQPNKDTFVANTLATTGKMIQYNFLFTLDELLKGIYKSDKITIEWIRENISLKFSTYFTIANTKLYITVYNFNTNKFESPYLNIIQSNGNLDATIPVIKDEYLSADNTIIISIYSDNVVSLPIEATMRHAELSFELKTLKFGNIAIPSNTNIADYSTVTDPVDILLYDTQTENSKRKGYFSGVNLAVEVFYEKNMYQGMTQSNLKRFYSKDHLYFNNDKVLTEYHGFISTIPNGNTLYVNENDTHYPYYKFKNINDILPLATVKKAEVIPATLMDNSLLMDTQALMPVALPNKVFGDTTVITGELIREGANVLGCAYDNVFNQESTQFGLLNTTYKPSHTNNRLNIVTGLVHCKQTNEIYLMVLTNLCKNDTFISNNSNETYIDLFEIDGRPLLKLSRKS